MKNNINKVLRLMGMIALMLIPMTAMAAPTARQQLNTAVQKYLTKNLTVTFSYSGSMGAGSGTLKTAGKKFALETSVGSTWYDGRQMWTYSPRTKETTLVNPSASELAEANPISILGSTGSFKAAFAAKQTPGNSTIVLTPAGGKTGVKRVVVVLNAKTLQPTKIDLTSSDGSRTVLTVKSLKTGSAHAASAFQYPAAKYPKVKVVDLR